MKKKKKQKELQKEPELNQSPFIELNPEIDDAPDPYSVPGQRIGEAAVLTVAQRREAGIRMRRRKTRLKVQRQMAAAKFAPQPRLKARAQKAARRLMRKRMAGARGANYANLSPSDKMAIDRLLIAQQTRINQLAMRLMPAVRQAESIRLQNFRTRRSKKGNVREEYITEAITLDLVEGGTDNIEALLRVGLADRNQIDQYRRALKDPDTAVKYVHLRDKLAKMFKKLFTATTKDQTVLQKVKQHLQRERDYGVSEDCGCGDPMPKKKKKKKAKIDEANYYLHLLYRKKSKDENKNDVVDYRRETLKLEMDDPKHLKHKEMKEHIKGHPRVQLHKASGYKPVHAIGSLRPHSNSMIELEKQKKAEDREKEMASRIVEGRLLSEIMSGNVTQSSYDRQRKEKIERRETAQKKEVDSVRDQIDRKKHRDTIRKIKAKANKTSV